MQPQEKHAMEISRTHPSGAEEWFCPICGLRFVMQWPPAYKKIILEEGDPTAIHSGGKGGVEMGLPQFRPVESTPDEGGEQPAEINEDTLDAWLEFLEDMNINDQLDTSTGSN